MLHPLVGAFADGDALGSTGLTLTNAGLYLNYTAQLLGIDVFDTDNQSAALDLLFFNALTGITVTNNAALVLTAALYNSRYVGRVSLGVSDYTTYDPAGTPYAIGSVPQAQLGAMFKAVGVSFFCVPVVRVPPAGTGPTYTVAPSFKFTFLRY